MAVGIFIRLVNAQAGDDDSLLSLLNQFAPLIRGTAAKYLSAGIESEFEDAVSILQLKFIEAVRGIHTESLHNTNDAALVCYLQKAMLNTFRQDQRKRCSSIQQYSYEDGTEHEKREIEYRGAIIDVYDGLILEDMKAALSQNEYAVIREHVILGQSIASVAESLGMSRQNANKLKLSALNKLKIAFTQ